MVALSGTDQHGRLLAQDTTYRGQRYASRTTQDKRVKDKGRLSTGCRGSDLNAYLAKQWLVAGS